MKEIKVTFKSLIPTAIWSIILLWIPFMIDAIRILFVKYTYDEEQIVVKTGVINQVQEAVPFYRLQDVKAEKNILESIFNVGKITLYDKNKTIVLKYVENPDDVANDIRELMLEKRTNGQVQVSEFQM